MTSICLSDRPYDDRHSVRSGQALQLAVAAVGLFEVHRAGMGNVAGRIARERALRKEKHLDARLRGPGHSFANLLKVGLHVAGDGQLTGADLHAGIPPILAAYQWENSRTVSTAPVQQNMSTHCTRTGA